MESEDRLMLWLIGGLFFGMFALVFGVAYLDGHTDVATHPTRVLPTCTEEDGSTQKECIWDDGSGLIVHNWDYGKHYSTQAR